MYILKYSDCEAARERFEAKIDRTGGLDACHPYRDAATYSDDYRRMKLKVDGVEKTVYLHRVAYVLATGESIDSRDVIDHFECGNPECCNPAHLRKTDARGNVRSRRPREKKKLFSDVEIMRMRKRWAQGESIPTLARAFRVRKRALRQAVSGKTYKHLPILKRTGPASHRGNYKLAAHEVAIIKARLNAGESRTKLAHEFGISRSQMSNIARGVCWGNVEAASCETQEILAA